MSENQTQKGVLVLGEVLFDVFPAYRRIGGAPFNVAFHLNQLGVPVRFASRVGLDDPGRKILEFCHRFDFPVEGIQVDKVKPTGEVRVVKENEGGHRFDILPDRAYDYLSAEPVRDILKSFSPDLVYFGTLAQRSTGTASAIRKIVEILRGQCNIVVDLNLRTPFYNKSVIEYSLNMADALKINDPEQEELATLFHLDRSKDKMIKNLMERFSIKNVIVTHGEGGSEFYRAGEETPFFQPAITVQPFVDTVGAGDAFCAMWMSGLSGDGEMEDALQTAAHFAGSVCSLKGALPESRNFYKEYRGF